MRTSELSGGSEDIYVFQKSPGDFKSNLGHNIVGKFLKLGNFSMKAFRGETLQFLSAA